MYDIESLIITFEKHDRESEKEFKDALEAHKKNNPDFVVPKHITSGFRLTKALRSMCEEILEIKKKTSCENCRCSSDRTNQTSID